MTIDAPSKAVSAVPTNIITGFLGVGKTSAILNLLKLKPIEERWAILVNEFGEIGVDGSLFQGQHSEEQQVFVREVPGGCMCCAAGLPMHIALNQLLSRAKPDRLLIEPTGLGHPVEVLQALTAEHYHEVIELQKIITLVDARKLHDERYTSHDTFNQQISIADIVVGNKQAQYGTGDKSKLEEYIDSMECSPQTILFADFGEIEFEYLLGTSGASEKFNTRAHSHQHSSNAKELASEAEIPEEGFLRAINQSEGFQSVGWRFEPTTVFDRNKLFAFLSGLAVERMKAVFITTDGVFGYNLAEQSLTEFELDDCLESRVEIINDQIDDHWEDALFSCIQNKNGASQI